MVRPSSQAPRAAKPRDPQDPPEAPAASGERRAASSNVDAAGGQGGHHAWAADVPHTYEAVAAGVEALLMVRHPTGR
ncbi:hypothetical protein [Kitasatospora sp. CB01950]|uniref:hypothetical protein n=1 Tax=Kitasatospora sp. CB01950 TaxID=1703930 RepID=UPI000960954C|nr:hypothetical protein [Kitasatospora sp. CB01950]OKJ13664.1 hypothetical protein AMK19_09465 [Kitasatospora sp. CB01950]